MKPRKPLKRGAPPKRQKPLSRSGKRLVRTALKRRDLKPRFKQGRDPAYLEWIRGLPCAAATENCEGPIEATHVKSRGAGGRDMGNVIPLCRNAHRAQHSWGIQTWAKYAFPMGGFEELKRLAAEAYPAQYEKAVALGWVPGETG